MPLYEYRCDACGHRFEKIQKFSDAPIEVCPSCGAQQVQKLLSSPAIQFKGSGWYITDYARKGGATDTAAKSDTKDGGAKDTKETTSTTSDTKTTTAAPVSTDSTSSKS